MDRRLFIEKVGMAGLAVPFLSSFVPGQQLQPAWQRRSAPALVQAARDVRRGLIGTLHQITITHTCLPECTGSDTLLQMARQDIDLSGFLAHLNLS